MILYILTVFKKLIFNSQTYLCEYIDEYDNTTRIYNE